MRKILKKMKDEKGSITSVVLVTVLFFIIILSTALMISGTQRKSQLDSEITLKQVYQNQVDDAEKISKKFINIDIKVPIPEGYYYVGGTEESGVVISDNVADKNKYKGEENVGKDLDGNQWVWVPVETPTSLYTTVSDGIALSGNTGVKTKKYTNSGIIDANERPRVLPGDESGFREPDILTHTTYGDTDEKIQTAGFSSLANMAETMVSEYDEMIRSIEKYKGFYIGRYELSVNGEKTGITQTRMTWYEHYKNCTMLAVNSKVKTRMIWSAQWDATCEWLSNSGFSITDSKDWGNFPDYPDKDKNEDLYQNTGHCEAWKANNIYDFAGNCLEFTQEAYTDRDRTVRGGSYRNLGSTISVSSVTYYATDFKAEFICSRPTLYLLP